MRLRTVAFVGLAAAAAASAAVAVRRRREAPPAHEAQLGRDDGTSVRLREGDPRLPALRARAAELRTALEVPS